MTVPAVAAVVVVAAHPPPAPNPHAEADPPPPAPTPQRPRFACLPPFLRYVAPPLRGTASTVTVAPFPPVAVAVTGAVAGALVKPCFNAESNELPLQDVNSISFLLDQLAYFLFCHCDEAVIKSQIGSASLSVRLLFDCSVVLFRSRRAIKQYVRSLISLPQQRAVVSPNWEYIPSLINPSTSFSWYQFDSASAMDRFVQGVCFVASR